MFNRKLKKHSKVFAHLWLIEVVNSRELYTRHGVHLNWKGKEYMARKIVNVIKEILSVEKSDPIEVKWKEEIEEVGSPQAENGEIEKVKKDMYKDDAGDYRQGNNEQKKGLLSLVSKWSHCLNDCMKYQ
jgi:hypothetical protein